MNFHHSVSSGELLSLLWLLGALEWELLVLSPSPSIPIQLCHCLPPQGSPQALRSLPWKKTAQNSYFDGNTEAVSRFRAVLEVTLPLLWAPTSQGDEVPTQHLPPVQTTASGAGCACLLQLQVLHTSSSPGER